jgi:hypothetical protein
MGPHHPCSTEDAHGKGFPTQGFFEVHDIGVIAHSSAFLQLLRLQWTQWDYNWVDPLDQCLSEAEFDNDNREDDAAYGPDIDNIHGLW